MSTSIEHSRRFTGVYNKLTFFLAKIHILKLHTKKFVGNEKRVSAKGANYNLNVESVSSECK